MARHRKPQAILLFVDGQWTAVVFRHARGEWEPQDSERFAGASSRQFPDGMLRWSAECGARRVRVVVPGDVHTLRMDLPEDLDIEETHTAIAYEASPEIGTEAHLLRVSAVAAEQYRLGARPGTVLVAGHERDVLDRYAADCENHGLRFEGVGPLELAALARHGREAAAERLLILRRHAGFLAVPAGEHSDFFLGGFAFGALSQEDPDREAERLAQARRSFGLLAETPIHVVATSPLPDERIAALRTALGVTAEFRVESMDDFAPRMLRHVAWSPPVGTGNGCALVGLPPRVKDPRRVGTWMCIGVILVAAAALLLLWKNAANDLAAVRQREREWEALVAARAEASKQYEGILGHRNDLTAIHAALTNMKPVSPALLELVGVLKTSMPPYTRISAIRQVEGGMEVEGKALWPQGVSMLADSLAGAVRSRGYRLEPGTLGAADDQGERVFSYRLVPVER
jgi:hypothetical protein